MLKISWEWQAEGFKFQNDLWRKAAHVLNGILISQPVGTLHGVTPGQFAFLQSSSQIRQYVLQPIVNVMVWEVLRSMSYTGRFVSFTRVHLLCCLVGEVLQFPIMLRSVIQTSLHLFITSCGMLQHLYGDA